MSCFTNGIRHITVLKQWACPASLMASVTLLFWNSEHVLLHKWHPSHYCSETVSMSCSTNGIRHITVLKQWACPAPLMTFVTLLFWNSWTCPTPLMASSHYCSEAVSMSCSTNGTRHITVPKQWACPAPLMTSVTLLFWNSEHVLLN
jgi:cytosine/uracil/thiamine/allantoin permease